MNPLSANPYASQAESLSEFPGDEAAIARQLLGLRQDPSAALQTRIGSLAKATGPRPAAGWQPWRRWPTRQRWAAGALMLAVVLAVALAIAGPSRVLAEFQRLLGYVHGVGFVDLDATRVLTAPVQVRRNDVTLRITQVLAQPDRTVVVFESDGLPPQDQLWSGPARDSDFDAELRLLDGQSLELKSFEARMGAGTLEFPPLPADIFRLELLMPRLPLVPPGAAAEGWLIPLVLRPATGELVAELFPQPYAPDATDAHHGVTLRVLNVAHSPDETVVRLQVQWENTNWDRPTLGYFSTIQLRDELGHVYYRPMQPSDGSTVQTVIVAVQPEGSPAPTPPAPTFEVEEPFAPLSPSAQELTLWLDSIGFNVGVEETFTLDLGPAPQMGDAWPLDVWLEVEGLPVHITGARITQDQPPGSQVRTHIEFTVDPGAAVEGRRVAGLSLMGEPPVFNGSGGSSTGPDSRYFYASVTLAEGQPIPADRIRVQVRSAFLALDGPWAVRWTVPGRDAPAKAPLTLTPAASQTHAGLTLQVTSVTLTDRLTLVTLGLQDPSPGLSFSQILRWTPERQGQDFFLEDNLGYRYGPADVAWQGLTYPLTDTLLFPAAQPLARGMTLHVPAVEVAIAGRAAFDVTLPDRVGLVVSGDQPNMSDPWLVDIPVSVAGHTVRFTRAQLIEANGTILLSLAAELDGPAEQALTSLQLASVRDPGGREVDLGSALSYGGPSPEDGKVYLSLSFSVAAPSSLAIQPGRYHVELGGITQAVRGPWELTWNLGEP